MFNLACDEKIFYTYRFFDITIDIELESCHDIAIWKILIYDNGNCTEIEPALGRFELHRL